jgi:hypothetical protein
MEEVAMKENIAGFVALLGMIVGAFSLFALMFSTVFMFGHLFPKDFLFATFVTSAVSLLGSALAIGIGCFFLDERS